EALARLRAATQKAAPTQAPAAQPIGEVPSSAEKPRFGINSLINRMTGAQEGAPSAERPARQQPPVQARGAAPAPAPAPRPAEAADPDQERIEIPAFLRRQAN
ncbi:MAG: cell division protein FtsZ, partial [Pseudomonadota bacterium]